MPQRIFSSSQREPLISRQIELDTLGDVLNRAIEEKRHQLVLIEGDFGAGKTFLVEHFLDIVQKQDNAVLIGRGKCSLETKQNGLVPFVQLLVTILDQSVRWRLISRGLSNFLKEVAPLWLDIVTLGAAGAFVRTIEESHKLFGRSFPSQEEVFIQYGRILSKLSDAKPVIAFIDDVHWADESSLELLFHLWRNLEAKPLLFLCTLRPTEASERRDAHFIEIVANLMRYGAIKIPLREQIDTRDYLACRYPGHVFPPEFVRRMEQITGGHPLFVSELCSLCEDNPKFSRVFGSTGEQSWTASLDEELSNTFPVSLSEVLAQRVGFLSDNHKQVLECASVEGDTFAAQVVACVLQMEEMEICESLDALEQRYRLIKEQGVEEVETLVCAFA